MPKLENRIHRKQVATGQVCKPFYTGSVMAATTPAMSSILLSDHFASCKVFEQRLQSDQT